MTGSMRILLPLLLPHHKTQVCLWCFNFRFSFIFCYLKYFWQEILILEKFWFHRSTQNTFKPIVWHLFHQNMLNISDFMKIIDSSKTFIKSLIINIFWCNKCQTRGLKVFWVHSQNQNLSKLNISCPKNVQSDKKTCQEVIKLCFSFSKLCLPSSKLCFSSSKLCVGKMWINWICRCQDQSLITHANWKVKSSMQLSVFSRSCKSRVDQLVCESKARPLCFFYFTIFVHILHNW